MERSRLTETNTEKGRPTDTQRYRQRDGARKKEMERDTHTHTDLIVWTESFGKRNHAELRRGR